MRSIIVGTAGHIDHGKTALIKALTGIDADRLQEEKQRGITIDIGFAHLELSQPTREKLRLGFIDVPGHERFVRNMLAGVGGIDLVLLVISAEESIKPQTREHFDICRLLSVRRGITVLTKADLVDRETLEVVTLEVEEFLRGSFLDPAHAPIIALSARSGAGLDELKRSLITVAAQVPARASHAHARLPIDRVFTMKGFGTVVTGTLLSGTIRREGELEVFPSGRKVRVRGVQVYGQNADEAFAGQRTALNLAGASREDLARGMILAPPDLFRSTTRVLVLLSLLSSAKPLQQRARVHLHAYTSETIAEVRLFGQSQVQPGQSAYAELRLRDATLLWPQDRFILRQFSPVVTIAGGVVLDASSYPEKKFDASELSRFLHTLASGSAEDTLAARVARQQRAGLSVSAAMAETGWLREQVESAAGAAEDRIRRTDDLLMGGEVLDQLRREVLTRLEAFHQDNPLVAGIGKEALREKLAVSTEVFSALLRVLTDERAIEVSAELVRLAGRGIILKSEEAESKKAIEEAFASAGLKVPALEQVLAGLKLDRRRAQKIVTLLLRDKVLIKISDELVFHRRALDELRREMAAYKVKSPKINVGAFKDLTGVSRKYAIPLLEYLDRERVTMRAGEERIIL